MTDNIKPAHAISIWASPDLLYLELPNLQGGDHPHYLKLPLNVWGMTQAVEIVKARHAGSRLGEKGDQTQAQAEAEMKRLADGFDPMKIKTKSPMPLTPSMRESVKALVRRMVG